MNKDLNSPSIKRNEKPNLGAITILIVIVVVIIFLSLTTKTFLNFSNIYSIVFSTSIKFFALIGFTYLVIMGEIDLSVGSVYGFGGAIMCTFMIALKLPLLPALILSLLVAAFLGFLNGFFVVWFRLNSMMITLGMMSIAQGFTNALTSSIGSQGLPADYRNIIKFSIFGVDWSIIAFILLVVVLEILLYRSTIFRKIYYIGENPQTAVIYGIKANRIKIITFISSSVLSAFGGIVATSRIAHAYPTTGSGLEFTMVTAAILGGASLYGGRGSILRSALGLMFLAIIENGMVAFNIDPYIQLVVTGVILIVAVFLDAMLNRKKY
jgi:ribose transport system permease protein